MGNCERAKGKWNAVWSDMYDRGKITATGLLACEGCRVWILISLWWRTWASISERCSYENLFLCNKGLASLSEEGEKTDIQARCCSTISMGTVVEPSFRDSETIIIDAGTSEAWKSVGCKSDWGFNLWVGGGMWRCSNKFSSAVPGPVFDSLWVLVFFLRGFIKRNSFLCVASRESENEVLLSSFVWLPEKGIFNVCV